MSALQQLLENNRVWARRITGTDPVFFDRLARQQAPEYLWIGCSDSRVPANEIVGLLPGELFVHRNVANLVVQTDLNCLSVMQYAVDVLRVRHVIVCGHYDCGGVRAAFEQRRLGLIDNWLRAVRRLYLQERDALNALASDRERLDRLCELNVIRQVINVCDTTVVQNAWERGQSLHVHGLIYSVRDGILKDLGVRVTGPGEIPGILPGAPDSGEDP